MTGSYFEKGLSGVVVDENTDTTAPTVASPYVGTWALDSAFSNVMVTMACDQTGTLFFDFYDVDGTEPTSGTTPTSTFPVSGFAYAVANANEFHQAVKGPRWFRARFVPDVDAATFRINTYFVTAALANLPLNQAVPTDQDAIVTRAFLSGFDQDGNSKDVPTDSLGRIGVNAGLDTTLFAETVTVDAVGYISCKFDSTAQMDVDTYDNSSGGTTSSESNGNLLCASGTGATNTAIRVSKDVLIYQPGHEGRAKFTSVFDGLTVPTGTKAQIGLFGVSGNNGAYLELDDTSLAFVHLRGGSEAGREYLADWNGRLSEDYVKEGEIVPLSYITGVVWRIRFGYLGYRGLLLEAYPPDPFAPPVFAHFFFYDDETAPLFTETVFTMQARVIKTSGATSTELRSGSWEASSLGGEKNPIISAENSTEVALSAAAAFTGDWQPIGENKGYELVIQTDQVSGTDGIRISFSDRGDAGAVERDYELNTFSSTDATNGSRTIIGSTRLSYIKVSYTNGGTLQGSMFMQLRLHRTPLETTRNPVSADIESSDLSTTVHAAIAAANDAAPGILRNITRGPSGGFRTSILEFEAEAPIKALTNFDGNQSNVGTSAVQIVGSPLSGRKTVAIKALSSNNAKVYIGKSGVTTGSGFELDSSEAVIIEIDDTAPSIYAIASSGTQRVCWMEVA